MHGQGTTYIPDNKALAWFERRLPVLGLLKSSFVDYPTPRNLNYWWTFGGILTVVLMVQIITGIVLVMHYTPSAAEAFNSVEHIMRNVNYGWLSRYVHANGASMFFLAVYVHIFRGLYYGSYKDPREILWILGVILFLLMMATAFMGYVLPWGQMSFWAATVITNLFSAIPLRRRHHRHVAVGRLLGRSADAEALLLAALSAAVRDRWRGAAAHLGAARRRPEQSDRHRREVGQGYGRRSRRMRRRRTASRSSYSSDPVRVLRVLCAELSRPRRTTTSRPIRCRRRRTSCPNGTSCRSTRSCARSRRSSAAWWRCSRSIAVLVIRAVARHVEGALGALSARSTSSSSGSSLLVCIGLGYLGAKPAEGGYVIAARILTSYYFLHFLVILPLLGFIEKPKPLPASISESVLKGKEFDPMPAR